MPIHAEFDVSNFAIGTLENETAWEDSGRMTTFDEREKGFEAQFKHGQDLTFRIQNRRNKLLGLWAAELLGLPAHEADLYAREVVASDFESPGDDDVHDKVYEDLRRRGVDLSDHRLRRKMDQLMHVAREQVMTEIR